VRTLVIADEEKLNFDHELRADLLISCGDLSETFIHRIAEMTLARHIVAVKGNHDSTDEFKSPIKDLHLTLHTISGVTFGGFSGCWRYKPKGNYLFDQEEVETLMSKFPPVDVFIAHNSPRQVHQWDDTVHMGFDAFNTYIRRTRPSVFIHGHQHVNAETLLRGTRIIGVFGQRWINLPSRE